MANKKSEKVAKPAAKAKTKLAPQAAPKPKEVAKAKATSKDKTKDKAKLKEAVRANPSAKESAGAKAAEKPAPIALPKKGKAHSEHTEQSDSGDTLIKMAKEEMAKINAASADPEKAEKTGKFKPIKVERGNLADEKAKWVELNKRYGKEKAQNYKMSESFQALKPMNHKVLGWGFILTNDNDRLEVLFQNGIKILISNYKPH